MTTAKIQINKRGNVIIDKATIAHESENIVCIEIMTSPGSTHTHMYGKGHEYPGIGVSRVDKDGSSDKDLATLISFTQYPGWDVFCTSSRGSEIRVCIFRP